MLALLCLAALAAGVSADDVKMTSMAPGPAMGSMQSSSSPKADLLFILSAKTANFTSPSRLVLGDVSYTVQFTGNSRQAGIYPTGLFLNSSTGAPFQSANGEWLGAPQGVLFGTAKGGNTSAVVLDLASPTYDPEANTVTFAVNATKVPKYKGGTVASVVSDAEKSVGPTVFETVDATTELKAVALFIDTTRLALGKSAETKWWGWGGGWGGGGWGGWNNGWGYQPYYQPYYYNGWNGGWGGCGCG